MNEQNPIDFSNVLVNTMGIDPLQGLDHGGVSDSTQMGMEQFAKQYDPGVGDSLAASLQRMSQLSLTPFHDLYANAKGADLNMAPIVPGTPGLGSASIGIPGQEYDPSLSTADWRPNTTAVLNIDDYYTAMSDEWANIDPAKGRAAAILGGAATGAATGFLIAGGIGAAVGGILGGIEGARVAPAVGKGYIRNKNGINEEAEYQKQGFWGRAGAGLMKMTHSADAMMLGTLGTIGSIPQAIAEGSFSAIYNNKFAKFIDEYDKASEGVNKVYQSNAYKNASLIGSLGYSEFWADKAAPGVGFMLGAIGAGKGAGLIFRGVGLGASTTRAASTALLTDAATQGTRAAIAQTGKSTLFGAFRQALAQDLRSQTIKSLTTNFGTLLTSAAPESGMEARGAMNEAREQYIQNYKKTWGRPPSSEDIANFDKANVNSGNAVFAANLAVVGLSNWIQFGDTLGINKTIGSGLMDNVTKRMFGLGIKRTAVAAGESGLESATFAIGATAKQKMAYRIFKALESPVSEGLWEEGIQNVISGTHKIYLESRYNPQAMESNKSLLKSFGESFVHTYTSREGWDEIMVGALIGAGGSVRVKGGLDILGQREVSHEYAQAEAGVERLNRAQDQFIDAHRQVLEAEALVNKLELPSVRGVHNKIGALNQQMVNTRLAKENIANGQLEMARANYRNAVMSKVVAEKLAGISDSSKFDVGMMIDNIPEDVLKDQYGFSTQEQMDDFKEATKKDFESQYKHAETMYDFAENLDLRSTSPDFTSQQLTEMAALNLFQGTHAAVDSNETLKTLEQITGLGGIADSVAYYHNLSNTNKARIQELEDKRSQLKQLEDRQSRLLQSYSLSAETAARQPENEEVNRKLMETQAEMDSVTTDMQALNSQIDVINDTLSNAVNKPTLPLQDVAQEFFDQNNLRIADQGAVDALDKIKGLEEYVDNLRNSTGKSAEDAEQDLNKAEVINRLIDTYKTQMELVRNFAKTATMLGDPNYVTNLSRTIFGKVKKKMTKFDLQNWIDNNEAGFNEQTTEKLKDLVDALDNGDISEYDLHTYLSNAEIMRMGRDTQDLTPLENLESEDFTTVEEIARASDKIGGQTERLENIRDKKISKIRQKWEEWRDKVFNDGTFDLSKMRNGEQSMGGILPPGTITPQNSFVNARDLNEGDIIVVQGAERKIALIERDLFGVTNIVFEDGSSWTNTLDTTQDWTVEKVSEPKATVSEQTNAEISSETPIEQAEDTNMDEFFFKQFEQAEQAEIDRVNAEFAEAVNPLNKNNQAVNEQLNKINDVIQQIVDEANGLYNLDYINEFSGKDIKKIIDRVDKLLAKDELTQDERTELDSLLDEVNNWGLIEGTVHGENKIRLSDLLEQRSQLEHELFNPDVQLTPLSDEEYSETTFSSNQENEESLPEFKSGQRTGDAAVTNTYDFSTFKVLNNGVTQIANITPQGFAEGLNPDAVYVRDSEGNSTQIDLSDPMWDNQINEGDVVSVNFNGTSVTFTVDKSRRVNMPSDFMQVVNDHSNFNFNQTNQIGSTGYHVLTTNVNGVETYVPSDFGIDIDMEAAQSLKPGDAISFEYDSENPYNTKLKEQYDNVTPGESDVYDVRDLVYDLIDDYKNTRDKATMAQLRSLLPSLDRNSTVDAKKIVDKVVKDYESQFDEEAQTKAEIEFKNSMVIYAVDFQGNRVGVVKSIHNASVTGNGRSRLDHLRSQMYEEVKDNNFENGTKSKVKVPVQIVYMGIPNIKAENGEKVTYRFSTEPGDNNIHPNSVITVGYVSYNKIEFADGRKVSTPYNYAKKIMDDTTYDGRKVPVIMFNNQGKEVIYPITLEPKEGKSLSEQFEDIMAKEGTITFSELVSEINTFLSENGIPKNVRVSSLEFDTPVANAREILATTSNVVGVDELMNNPDLLEKYGIIDINIEDKPFAGPKIRFDLNKVPDSGSPLLEENNPSNSINTTSMEEISEEEDSCIE